MTATDEVTQVGLADRFGRLATDLRVSLTDRCNLRCTYCMPEEGLDWLAKPDLLTDDEIVRLVAIAVTRLGVREIRFTGGEPLLRRGLVGIVARTTELTPRPEVSLTTNGIGLARQAQALKDAGLDRVNVSLDTIRADTFVELARRDRLKDVLAGLEAAHDSRADTGEGERRPDARRERPTRRPSCSSTAWNTATNCASSSRCHWTLSTAGTARPWSPRTRSTQLLDERFGLTPTDPSARGSAPAESFLVRWRAADRRHHRVGDAAVLR